MNKDQTPEAPPRKPANDRAEKALDEAIEESFPASDPPAIGHSNHVGAPRKSDERPTQNSRAGTHGEK
jgi:hypothetical protein